MEEGHLDACLPPALLRNKERIRLALEQALGHIPSAQREQFRLDLLNSGKGSLTRYLFQMICLHAGFAFVTLHSGNSIVFQYGVSADWADRVWTTIERDFYVGEIRLTFRGVLPIGIRDLAEISLDDSILVHARNVFLNSHGLRDTSVQNVFAGVERDMRPILERSAQAGVPVTITHFLFQDLRIYFSLSGEYRSEEIMGSIQKMITENLKKIDTIFRISPLSYVVISPGAEAKQIKERFKSIYIQIKSLVLDYDLKQHTVSSLPIRFTEIWNQLL